MSDLMLLGVLRMPVSPQSDELTLRQYINRGRQAADLIEQQQALIADLEQRNKELAATVEEIRHNFIMLESCHLNSEWNENFAKLRAVINDQIK